MGLKNLAIKSLSKGFPNLFIKHKINDEELANQTIKGYKLIRENNLFDDEFYIKNYPKLKNADLDLLLHYIFFGFDEGKSPSANFDGIFYKNHYDDALNSKLNPLVHYALYGLKESRLIKPIEKPLHNYIDSNKKQILYISHEKIGTVGGTGFTNLDIVDEAKNKYQIFILTSTGYEVELWQIANKNEKIAHFHITYDTDFTYGLDNTNYINSSLFDSRLKSLYNKVLNDLEIDLIHINHLMNHSFDLIDVIADLKIPYLLSIHDFYYLCPSIHLINNKSSYCSLTCLNNDFSCNCVRLDNENELDGILTLWRKNCFKLLKNACYIIFPSQSSVNFYKKVFKDLNNFKLIEHGRDFPDIKLNPRLTNKYPIKIAIPGHISPHKGSFFIQEIKKQDKDNLLDLYFVGTTRPLLKDIGKTTGRYDRNNLGNILEEINPSFVAILSTCPETYCHTLSESWNLGLPVIATDLGALSERINKSSAGWLIDYENPINAYNQILAIIQNLDDYLEKVDNINNVHFKSKKQMANEYLEMYQEVLYG